MIALRILDQKEFTRHLFIGNIFHPFLLCEATITTFNTFHIDGSLKKSFYTEEEQEAMHLDSRDFSTWEECKPFSFSIIKGKHTPLHFKIIFQLSKRDMERFLISSGVSMSPEDLFGLYLNITFDGTNLICTTGSSIKTFTLDKTLDNSWDFWVTTFFKQNGIASEKVS